MQFIFLTQKFYDTYAHCTEIERKTTRPYIQICIEVNGVKFAIPLRSNIHHKHVLWTNQSARCGLDFSKTVVIDDAQYINTIDQPYIRPEEFKVLKGKDYTIKQKLRSYIKTYRNAKLHLDKPRNAMLCQYSTLQYFESFITDIT